MQVDGVAVAILRIARQRLQNQPLQLGRDLLVVGRRRDDLDVPHLLERGEVGLADEQALAREQLVKDDADREDVAALVDGQAAHLLRRHVAELPLQDAGLRGRGLARRLGNAEVDELDLPVVPDEHVLRRDVAMDEVQLAPLRVALVVGVVQPLADLHHHPAGHRHRQRVAAAAHAVEDRAQVAAVHVLQRDEEASLDLTEVEDLRDVRVLKLHGDLRLVDEHRDELFVLGDVRQDALDGQQALEALHPECLRLEDLGHASDVDPFQEVVLPEGDGLLQGPHITDEFSQLQPNFRHYSKLFWSARLPKKPASRPLQRRGAPRTERRGSDTATSRPVQIPASAPGAWPGTPTCRQTSRSVATAGNRNRRRREKSRPMPRPTAVPTRGLRKPDTNRAHEHRNPVKDQLEESVRERPTGGGEKGRRRSRPARVLLDAFREPVRRDGQDEGLRDQEEINAARTDVRPTSASHPKTGCSVINDASQLS